MYVMQSGRVNMYQSLMHVHIPGISNLESGETLSGEGQLWWRMGYLFTVLHHWITVERSSESGLYSRVG